jgi:DNA-directed RNA polymerase specialized sigma24 family protein
MDDAPSSTGRLARIAEAEKAIAKLSSPDLQKLMLIAHHFCRRRGLTSSTLEPEELLSEAIVCTLNGQKQWRKGIPILKHLDRAMENISGHTLARAHRETPPVDREGNILLIEEVAVAETSVVEEVQVNETYLSVKSAFEDDPQAWEVVTLKIKETPAAEIRKMLNLSHCEYETLAKRIRRTMVKLRLE